MNNVLPLSPPGVKFKAKSDSPLMRFIGKFSREFFWDRWTTIGKTIYYPATVDDPRDRMYWLAVKHEMVYVEKYKKYGVPLFLLLYFFFPVPILFAYFRWVVVREAFMVQINRGASIDVVVDVLWNEFAYVWPKEWMNKWFQKQKSLKK